MEIVDADCSEKMVKWSWRKSLEAYLQSEGYIKILTHDGHNVTHIQGFQESNLFEENREQEVLASVSAPTRGVNGFSGIVVP